MKEEKPSIHLAFRKLVNDLVETKDFFHPEDCENKFIKKWDSPELRLVLKNMNGFIAIFNYKTGIYEIISEGLIFNLGYMPQDFIGEIGVQFVYSIMEPQHALFFVEVIMNKVLKYLSEHATMETGTDYRFNCCLKLRNIHNVYKWFLLDTIILQNDENGFPVRTMITITNIETFKKDELVYYNIMKKDASQIYQVVFEDYANRTNEETLTPRETEILSLISRGYSNKKIAEVLFISTDTVKSHRRNILQKTKCKGPIELANFAFSRGLV